VQQLTAEPAGLQQVLPLALGLAFAPSQQQLQQEQAASDSKSQPATCPWHAV
jgi:hypothetical protein